MLELAVVAITLTFAGVIVGSALSRRRRAIVPQQPLDTGPAAPPWLGFHARGFEAGGLGGNASCGGEEACGR